MGFFYVLVSVVIKAYRLIQAFSIDIALGAVIISTAMAKYYGTSLTMPVQLSLFMAVWLIYTFDHLMDAERSIPGPLSLRHQLHRQYRTQIAYISILAILLGLTCVYLVPAQVIRWGVMAAAFIVIYFLLVRYTAFWVKELFVAIGYTAGVFLAPLAMLVEWPTIDGICLILIVFLIALINLLLFSLYDHQVDERNGFHSLAIKLGTKRTRHVIALLLCLTLVFNGSQLIRHPSDLMYWTLFFMTVLLSTLMYQPPIWQQRDHYRIIGDGVFLIPALYLIYA